MSLRKVIPLASCAGFAAWWLYLRFFDKDMKMIYDDINAERARRVHSCWDDAAEHQRVFNEWQTPPYRLPYLR